MISIIIPAAGLAKRMRPLSSNASKSMIPVNGKPIIAYILDEVIKIYNQSIQPFTVSIRSCNDQMCNGEEWNQNITQLSSSEFFEDLFIPDNRYLQYKSDFLSSGGINTPKLYNLKINYGPADTDVPTINLISPLDNVGDNGNITRFSKMLLVLLRNRLFKLKE
jgi:hypothetical protein